MPIVINSKSCSNAGFWAKHLLRADTNERIEIIGFYGLSAETIKDAFGEMRVMAQGGKAKNFFSQYNINPRGDEQLSEAQWDEAHALHRKAHGLDHLAYFRVRHIKRDELGYLRVHEHGIALRVDPDTGKAIPDSLTAQINERTSRDLEIRFDLARGHSVLTPDRDNDRPDRRPKKHESFRGDRSGIDPEIVKADARAARQRSDNGQSFRAALQASGAYILARGDRRDFVIIDRGGDDHSLARRLGMKAAELRAFMADLDPASLPSVAEAKAQQQQARQAAQEALQGQYAAAAPSGPGQDSRPTGGPENKPQGHLDKDSSTSHLDEHHSGIGTDELGRGKRRPENDMADDDILSKQRGQRQAEEDRQAAAYSDMVADKNRADRFIQDWQRDHEYGERHKRSLQEAQTRSEAESDITDVRLRAIIAAGESRDFVQAVRREGAMISEEHAKLQRNIALEQDPGQKHLLELKRDIQHADYMALATERIAAMSNLNSEQYKGAMREQEVWTEIGTELRKERLELQRELARAADQDDASKRGMADAEKINTADRQRADFRVDSRGNAVDDRPRAAQAAETPFDWEALRRAVQQEAAAGVTAQATAETRTTEPQQRPAEVIHSEPTPPTVAERIAEARQARETTDARQSTTAEHAEMSDAKTARQAARSQGRAETEQSIAQAQERGYENSR
jgi:hypothetical protein